MKTTRRRVSAFLGAASALPLLPASPAAAQEKRITLMIFSSTWNGVFKQLSEGFTRETGIGVDIVVAASSVEGLVKLQAMRARPSVDVWFTAAGVAQRAATEPDLLAPMPVDKLSNWRDVIPGATSPTFAAAYYAPFGIVYRPDLVPGGKITSWQQLWEPGFRNKLAVPVPSVHPGRMLLVAAMLNGGSLTNIEPGFAKLQELRPNVAFWYTSDPQARRALAQGEVAVMMGLPSIVKTLADQGVRVEMVSPQPAPLVFEGVTIVRSGKEEMAARFVDRVLSPEWQTAITELWNMGPINRKVEPGKNIAAALPKPGDMVSVDESVINLNLGAWTEKFQQLVAK